MKNTTKVFIFAFAIFAMAFGFIVGGAREISGGEKVVGPETAFEKGNKDISICGWNIPVLNHGHNKDCDHGRDSDDQYCDSHDKSSCDYDCHDDWDYGCDHDKDCDHDGDCSDKDCHSRGDSDCDHDSHDDFDCDHEDKDCGHDCKKHGHHKKHDCDDDKDCDDCGDRSACDYYDYCCKDKKLANNQTVLEEEANDKDKLKPISKGNIGASP